VQKELDDSLSRKAFAECGPLQDRLDELLAKRAELPTVDELREEVRSAEAAMALAVKNRDFAGAAAGQAHIDEARGRLADVLAAQNEDEDSEDGEGKENKALGFESRAQLEFDITEISVQVKVAIDSKDFKKASLLQVAMDERESLRQFFPSVRDLQAALKAGKAELDEAVSKKAFARAEKITNKISELEKQLEKEKEKMAELHIPEETSKAATTLHDGQVRVFQSRMDLESEITKLSDLVSKAVKAKDFKKANMIQADADALAKLRDLLPSVAELQMQLLAKKEEMEAAISEKRFADADEINVAIDEIETTLKKEKSLAPLKPGGPHLSVKAKDKGDASVKTAPAVANVPTNKSVRSNATAPVWKTPSKPAAVVAKTVSKPVSKLRPAKPVTVEPSSSIDSVAQLLAMKRANATVVVSSDGSLSGILTDTDITRRVVAKFVDTALSTVDEVMTPFPTCVAMEDSAMDALTIMLENHFRHLPVVDDRGIVVGLLDIAKCLDDAIGKLEKTNKQSSRAGEDAVKNILVNKSGSIDSQAVALQALLGNLMAKAFGDKTVPTLRALLGGKPGTIVHPSASIREAGILMAETRKAALVVDNDVLVGVFTFKDMLSRAVAKGLDLDATSVADVMTPEPESVSPDMNALEALQTMHDNRFLTLPVCESDGTIVGLVEVLDVIYGCGGPEGWRSMFDSAMDVDDDFSDVTSINSAGKSTLIAGRQDRSTLQALEESTNERPVSKLRPSKPITSRIDDTILRVSQTLSSKRGAASLVVSTDGSLAGIMTDTDITRRVVAKHIDTSATSVSEVMTPNPTCVAMSDSAMDALTTMVENHFRHLPVVDDQGSVVGLLDIAKCLNDAISKLERTSEKTNSAAEDAVKQMVAQQGAGGAQAAALKALLGNLMSQAFGGKQMPTLRSLLAGKPGTLVDPSTSIRNCGLRMADSRKAALVVDDGELVGVFTFKDMMSRAVAKELDLDVTPVSQVMTPSPEFVSPDMTVLEALQSMHDNKFLTLPVCESDGRVVGLVDVMDVIHGCGGSQGWRSMFAGALEIADDQSDLGSVHSRDSFSVHSKRSTRKVKRDLKAVAKLRPSKAHLSISSESILSVTKMLQRKRGSASIVVKNDRLVGIVTDTDITRRVVAKHIDTSATSVSEVMTPNPTCVAMSDSAMDALTTMVENHFRHLPVVDDQGSVVGLLDIAKCLNDAISKLERTSEKTNSAAEDAVKQMVAQQGAGGAQAAALKALLGNLMSQAFGGKQMPTLRSLLAGKPGTLVDPSTSIRNCGLRMADSRKAALVVDDGELVGVFTFKDMMSRAVAKELDLDVTPVSQVMTPSPEFVSPDMTVLEALQSMHDNKFLTLPVCESDGRVVGLVDVMDVIHGCGGAEGWKSIFSNVMELDDISDVHSLSKSRVSGRRLGSPSHIKAPPETPYVTKLPGNIPATLEFEEPDDHASFNGSTIGDERGVSKLLSPDEGSLAAVVGVFKVTEPNGRTHRIRCETLVTELLEAVAEKVDIPRSRLQIQYVDDEGDTVVITTDHDVTESWSFARKANQKVAKLNAVSIEPKSSGPNSKVMAGAGIALTLVGVLAFVIMKPKKA
jgi:signal-transduction protein with cAMP-binding, CBS, and nucleotidyltransferase domain